MSLFDIFNHRHTGPADLAAGLLFGPSPNGEGDYGIPEPERRGKLFTGSIWLILIPLVLWLLGYISTLFPYLGHYAYGRHGAVTYYIPIGSRTMLLFKGQEAFIHYDVDSKPGSKGVVVDIRPWPAIGASPAIRRINGKTSGTLKVPIEKTGVYRFHHAARYRRESLSYSVTWGAR